MLSGPKIDYTHSRAITHDYTHSSIHSLITTITSLFLTNKLITTIHLQHPNTIPQKNINYLQFHIKSETEFEEQEFHNKSNLKVNLFQNFQLFKI
jgi:hypothetical protein